ncbi:hypothetical protein ZMTM_07470 [Methyloradius palustris]|uniref:Uncharacterized protein n=2 Tax=Methyloradius palustris TaxID=2778876 RepID=A0A8D5G1R4_9PROT|nr:hypothetical protein ZMTM_07470 [Methyloradius palustris]
MTVEGVFSLRSTKDSTKEYNKDAWHSNKATYFNMVGNKPISCAVGFLGTVGNCAQYDQYKGYVVIAKMAHLKALIIDVNVVREFWVNGKRVDSYVSNDEMLNQWNKISYSNAILNSLALSVFTPMIAGFLIWRK